MTVPSAGSSTYERWVLTLRAWAADPERTPLDLPPLADDTFSPDTYARLVDHILAAMRQASERWHEGLTRAWSTAATPYDLAREFVSLRTTLARRVQLARHASLPEAIRTALSDALRRDVERYQREAEDAVRAMRSPVALDTTWRDQMLQVVREHSFLTALDYDVSGARPEAPALPASTGPATPPDRRSFRRVMPLQDS